MTKAKYWRLPGGRYGGITSRGKRFIVDSLAKAKARVGKSSTRKSKSRRAKSSRRSVRKTARKRRNPRRRSFLSASSLFKFVRLAGLAYPGIASYQATKSVPKALGVYAGIGWDGKFNIKELQYAWTPYIMSCLVTHGVGKLNGIIRRL